MHFAGKNQNTCEYLEKSEKSIRLTYTTNKHVPFDGLLAQSTTDVMYQKQASLNHWSTPEPGMKMGIWETELVLLYFPFFLIHLSHRSHFICVIL